jgi:hypothetical protein
MSLLQLFTNNAVALLQGNISAADSVITVQSGLGSLFPQPSAAGEFFLITLESIHAPLVREIVRVEGRSGDQLTNCIRGQENTTARNWVSLDTLVDHRITAETIRQAFLQPDPGVNPNVGTGGVVYVPETIQPITTGTTATVLYADDFRGHKFWVSMYSPTTFKAQSFEILTIIQGNLADNTETITWTRTNRIGFDFKGALQIVLNTNAKTLNVNWQNNEPLTSVTVTIVRI